MMNFLINLRTLALSEIPDPGCRGGPRFDGNKYVLPPDHAFAMITPGGICTDIKSREFDLSPAILLYHPDTPPRPWGFYDLKYCTEALFDDMWTPFFDHRGIQISIGRICRSWPGGILNSAAVMGVIRDYLREHPYPYSDLSSFDWVDQIERIVADLYVYEAA